MTPAMTTSDLNAFLERDYPELNAGGRAYEVSAVGPGTVEVTLRADATHIRPGATVSGPVLMTLTDIACWLVILAHIGPAALTVTTHLSIDFLRKPAPGLLVGRARLLKLGKRLAVSACEIGGADPAEPFTAATATYSIPPVAVSKAHEARILSI
ncbi:MAG TPA: PaaI family thioesterase [Methylomirabilota bacterium]|nr:PaaI family thioesterase [Methylomirabilota bacterium]